MIIYDDGKICHFVIWMSVSLVKTLRIFMMVFFTMMDELNQMF